MISVRPMRPDELDAWHAHHLAGYIADRVSAGEPEDVARSSAEEQHSAFFPDGRPAPGHEVLVGEDDGHPVGIVWWGPHPRRPDDHSIAWLYDIEVDEAHRGAGHGRALLTALEERLGAAGIVELALNVFGENATARQLYASAGYREVAIVMSKSLS